MKYILILLSFIVLLSCNNGGNQQLSSADESMPTSESPQMKTVQENAPGKESPSVPEPRMVVKTGSINIRVENIENSRLKINALIKQYNGYMGSENQSTYDNSVHCSLGLRIPTKDFDNMLDAIEKLATYVDNRQMNVKDVTLEYVDIQARLNSRKAVEQSYLDLLKQAHNMDDILKIQEQLGAVRGEIESMQGQLNLLGSQVQYSSINVELVKTLPYTSEPGQGTGYKFIKALSEGWSGFVGFIIFMVYLWPFFLLAPIIWLIIRRYRRRDHKSIKD